MKLTINAYKQTPVPVASLEVGRVYKGNSSGHHYLYTGEGCGFNLTALKQCPLGGTFFPVSSAELIITD